MPMIDKFRPEGRLVNTLYEHKHPVNSIAVADDQSLFLTASREDGMVLIWSASDITDVTAHSIQKV
jgi:WD40 repeat protein